MSEKTYKIAFGGIVSAAAVVIMFLGSVIPFATISVPAIASVCVLLFVAEFGKASALGVYFVTAVLSFLVAPDKEMALLFFCFFGFYPVVKSVIEQKFHKGILGWVIKFLIFNLCIVSLYIVITKIFVIPAVQAEFREMTRWFVAGLLALSNITFFVFDIALTRLVSAYIFAVRPKLLRRY